MQLSNVRSVSSNVNTVVVDVVVVVVVVVVVDVVVFVVVASSRKNSINKEKILAKTCRKRDADTISNLSFLDKKHFTSTKKYIHQIIFSP